MTNKEAIEILKEIQKSYDYILKHPNNSLLSELHEALARNVAIENVLSLVQEQQYIIEGKEALINTMSHNEEVYEAMVKKLKKQNKLAAEEHERVFDKFEKEVAALNQVHKHDVDIIDEVKGEAVKLYKIIDEMVKYINSLDIDEDICMKNIIEPQLCNDEGTNCNYCIKEYFKRKVENK